MQPSRSSARPSGFCQTVASVLLAIALSAASPARAQFTSQTLPVNLGTILQAHDGNFYSLYPGDPTCTNNSADCAQLYRIPAGGGTPVSLFTFSPGVNPATGGSPVSLIEGPDGYLYGATVTGGEGAPACLDIQTSYVHVSCGYFFRIALDGSGFTVLHSFNVSDAPNPGNGAGYFVTGGSLILGSDGYFYGTSAAPFSTTAKQSLLSPNCCNGEFAYRLSLSGDFTLIHDFGNSTVLYPSVGTSTSALVEGTDGFFYGSTPGFTGVNSPSAGFVYRMSKTGAVQELDSIPPDDSKGCGSQSGTSARRVPPATSSVQITATILRERPFDTATSSMSRLRDLISIFHTFAADGTDGYDAMEAAAEPLVADGNIYGVAPAGRKHQSVRLLSGLRNPLHLQPHGRLDLSRCCTPSSGARTERSPATSSPTTPAPSAD